jgi:nucleoside-diphosphate-sugar epimerase
MRVFVTGSTGFIGSVVVRELISAGHKVLGLARSNAGETVLAAAGADVHRGSLEDPDSLRSGVTAADGVIHTAFIHDFSKYKENCETDRHAIEVLGAALAGSPRPMIIASGTGVVGPTPGRLATEEDVPLASSVIPRSASEEALVAVAARGVRTCVLRLPPSVHGREKQGLVTHMIARATQTGISAYVGDGLNRWPAVHQLDAAHLFRLALEEGTAGARYHAVADEGIALRDIAEVIGQRLSLPVISLPAAEAAQHFGWLAPFVGFDCPASSAQTQEKLGWRPTQPGLIPALDRTLVDK